MTYRPTNHPNDRRTSGYIGPTNLPTDGHQVSKGSYTSNKGGEGGVGEGGLAKKWSSEKNGVARDLCHPYLTSLQQHYSFCCFGQADVPPTD